MGEVEGFGGTPYDKSFAAQPLPPGEERCLNATMDPSFVAQSSIPEIGLPGADAFALALPEMPPLCDPDAAPGAAQSESLAAGQFTEPLEVYDCHFLGGERYEWYKATGIFTQLEDGTKAFVGVVEGSEEGPFVGMWQGGCGTGSSGGGSAGGSGGDGGPGGGGGGSGDANPGGGGGGSGDGDT